MTHVIAEKEKKSSSYKEGKLDTLSEEKTVKIKKFSKEYITKVLRKLDKSKRGSSSSNGNPLQSHDDHHSAGAGCANAYDGNVDTEMVMSVEEAMELASDEEIDEPEDMQHSSDEANPSPIGDVSEPPLDSVTPKTPPDLPHTLDPRLRHRTGEPAWTLDSTGTLKDPGSISI